MATAEASVAEVRGQPVVRHAALTRVIEAVIRASLFLALLQARFTGKDLAWNVAAVALALHSAAYQSEIFRAGFQSVPRGQLEAAQALGMRPTQSMFNVVLPQALRLSLPPLGNEFAVVIK